MTSFRGNLYRAKAKAASEEKALTSIIHAIAA
jgi:hypothetical protein